MTFSDFIRGDEKEAAMMDVMDKARREQLRTLALAATPQDYDSAEHKTEGGVVDCPACGGEGSVDLEADYCNFDDVAIGVQFYGIGEHHGAAESYYRAANPATVLALLDRIDELERQDAEYGGWDCAHCQRGVDANDLRPEVDASCKGILDNSPTERAVPEWQPIETAPRDNPRCLTYTPDRLCESDAISICPQNLLYTHSEATHWMPLPAAPGAGGAE